MSKIQFYADFSNSSQDSDYNTQLMVIKPNAGTQFTYLIYVGATYPLLV